jgi:hypothetical protein
VLRMDSRCACVYERKRTHTTTSILYRMSLHNQRSEHGRHEAVADGFLSCVQITHVDHGLLQSHEGHNEVMENDRWRVEKRRLTIWRISDMMSMVVACSFRQAALETNKTYSFDDKRRWEEPARIAFRRQRSEADLSARQVDQRSDASSAFQARSPPPG